MAIDTMNFSLDSLFEQHLTSRLRKIINKNRDILNYVLEGDLSKESPYSYKKVKIKFHERTEDLTDLVKEGLITDVYGTSRKLTLSFRGWIFCDSSEARAMHDIANKIYGYVRDGYMNSTDEEHEDSLQDIVQKLYPAPHLKEYFETVDRVLTYFNTSPINVFNINRPTFYNNPTSNIKILKGTDQIVDYKDFSAFLLACIKPKEITGQQPPVYASPFQNVSTSFSLDGGLVFIACGQVADKEKELGKELKSYLNENNVNAFFAETVNDLESLNTHIFKRLDACSVFIAILHKRLKGETPVTSVWVNQEIAIAAFLRVCMGKEIKSLVLYEAGTEIEGLIKYTINNPLIFSSDEQAFSKIRQWLENEGIVKKVVSE